MEKPPPKLSTDRDSIKNETEELDLEKLPPITRSLTGIIKIPVGKTYRELKEESLLEKYGLNSQD